MKAMNDLASTGRPNESTGMKFGVKIPWYTTVRRTYCVDNTVPIVWLTPLSPVKTALKITEAKESLCQVKGG